MIRKALLQIGAPALLAFMAWNAYLAVNHLKQMQHIAARTLESSTIQADISSVLKDLTDMETGQRGYLLTGNPSYLQPYTEAKGRIVKATRVDLLGNALVLVAPKDSKITLKIAPNFDLAGALGKDGHIALGEPNSVPAGKYAKASLTALGVWDSIESRIVSADNVRAALNFVAKGEVPLGVVYRSDAVSEPAVRVVDTFPDASHAPIVYPAAIVADHDTPAARKLLDLLRTPAAQAIFARHGFDAPSTHR